MKHYHSYIRRDAAKLYALKHPEVRLKDIEAAFGGVHIDFGSIRPVGPRSRAYDFQARSKKMRPYYDSKMIDRDKAVNLASKGVPHARIAEVLKCNQKYLSKILIESGYPGTKKKVSDEVILSYLAEHPNTDRTEMAAALGYATSKTIDVRLKALGRKVPIRRKKPSQGRMPRVSPERVKMLLRNKRLTYKNIAKETGYSLPYIKSLAARYGEVRTNRRKKHV